MRDARPVSTTTANPGVSLRNRAPDVTAAQAPGADDFADTIDTKAKDGTRVNAGDLRDLLGNQLVDHLWRAHLGDGDRQLAQSGLLAEQLTNPDIEAIAGTTNLFRLGRTPRHCTSR